MPDDELTWAEELALIGLAFVTILLGGAAVALALFRPTWWVIAPAAGAWVGLLAIMWVLRRSRA